MSIPITTHPAPWPAEALSRALAGLEALDARKASIARMRLVGKLSVEQIAFFMGRDKASVAGEWRFIRTWIVRELGGLQR